jgi:hypothetical protein
MIPNNLQPLTPPSSDQIQQLTSQIKVSTALKDGQMVGIIRFGNRTFSVKINSNGPLALTSEAHKATARLAAHILIQQGAFTSPTAFNRAKITKKETSLYHGNQLIATAKHATSGQSASIKRHFAELTKSINVVARQSLPRPQPMPARSPIPRAVSERKVALPPFPIKSGVSSAKSPSPAEKPLRTDVLGILQVAIPKRNVEYFNEEVTKIKADYKALPLVDSSNWQSILRHKIQIDSLHVKLADLRKEITVVLNQEPLHDTFKKAIKAKCEEIGATPTQIERYLNPIDPQSLRNNIFEHSILNSDTFGQLNKDLKESAEKSVEDILSKAEKDYKPKENAGGGNCFFLSVDQQTTPSTTQSWRARISEELRSKPDKYKKFVDKRIQTDRMNFPGTTKERYDNYCGWIGHNGEWGSEPELHAISNLTKRPVIVLQKVGEDLTVFANEINGHLKGEPLIFLNLATVEITDGKLQGGSGVHYEAMLPKASA